ncbi:hypothetical protein MIND_00977900 [Mycena indigotica]|uniref:Uncharacterized protein n=1 Tax=Mycena indigotica TaxID=2126181 RepID=A0A8H6SEG3_9AGAR|nr:uncharacterized protein MIND_00977900 [Mycena indigotica]KAF7297443.1 hypothetical protein MIND_00977900 [Mycena indigotica]
MPNFKQCVYGPHTSSLCLSKPRSRQLDWFPAENFTGNLNGDDDESPFLSLAREAWNHSSQIIEVFVRSLAVSHLPTVTHLYVAGASVNNNAKIWKLLLAWDVISAQALERATYRPGGHAG